jgi:NADH:ubiquinone oxidoreductase subunit 5 (subunit L)/multisubunit Na+/H+ antiporter MnhA subunit
MWIAVGYMLKINRGEEGERHTALVATSAASLSFLVAGYTALNAMLSGSPGHIVITQWFSSGELSINVSFMLDTLGITMSLLVSFIALLMLRFSVNYLHREAGFQRFFMILLLFTSAMQLIVYHQPHR